MAKTRNFKVIAGGVAGLLLIVVIGSAALAYRIGQITAESRQEAAAAQQAGLEAGNLQIGDKMPDFTVHDRDGNAVRLSDTMDKDHYTVVTFHHPDCPCSENCGKLISEMEGAGYDDVRVVGIMAAGTKDEQNLANLDRQIEEGIITFPVYLDHDRSVMNKLGATRTPEMWVLDKKGVIQFYGAPENTLFPGSEGHRYLLRETIDALREGNQPEIIRYDPIGCPIAG